MLQSPNWVKVCLVSTVFFLPPFSFFQSPLNREWRCVLASICRLQGSVSAEPHCRFLQVCLLFCFLSVPHEQASTAGILRTDRSAWQGRSAGPGLSGLDQLSGGLSGLTGRRGRWRYVPFVSHSQVLCSCTNGQYFSLIAGALKATRNREESCVTI